MSKWNESDYLASWPKYQPFPYAIRRGMRPVPNVNSVDWPQAQFAPPYLAPGEPSFQAYSYLKNDVPLASQQPRYTTTNHGPHRRSGVGPGGDNAALPGTTMRQNPSRKNMNRRNPILIAVIEEAPVRRQGWIQTGEQIPSGVPSTAPLSIPDSMLIPPSSRQSATGLDLGDGFAYELAPLQASAPYTEYGGIGAEGKRNGCGCAKANGRRAKKNPATGVLIVVGLAIGAAYFLMR